jgi:hypothetical protein
MLVDSALVGASGSARAGVGVTELAASRAPSLLVKGARAAIGRGTEGTRAQAAFRDEMLMLLDDAAEIAWRQARRARYELSARTAPRETSWPSEGTPTQEAAPPRRHRVKA